MTWSNYNENTHTHITYIYIYICVCVCYTQICVYRHIMYMYMVLRGATMRHLLARLAGIWRPSARARAVWRWNVRPLRRAPGHRWPLRGPGDTWGIPQRAWFKDGGSRKICWKRRLFEPWNLLKGCSVNVPFIPICPHAHDSPHDRKFASSNPLCLRIYCLHPWNTWKYHWCSPSSGLT